MENIAIHSASSFGGAQFYISCGQINVENGGNGTPGPLVAFPGAYTGYVSFQSHSNLIPGLIFCCLTQEPGILINSEHFRPNTAERT